MNNKRISLIYAIEKKFNCELVFANANLLHFKALSTVDPSDAAFEQILPKNVTRNCNILYERKAPVAGETMFVFAGMPNIPNYLVKTFGGINPKLNIWRLRNIAGYGVDLSGYRQDVAPTAEEVREHILTVYHLLNPNCKKKDFHKKKVELLSYDKNTGMWECGNPLDLYTVKVAVPAYLGVGSSVYINTYKKGAENYSRVYEYYGKGLLKNAPDTDYAKIFALRPDAIYDWFYSEERSVEDVITMFGLIEHSYVARPYLYYCKGEYTKIRNLFLVEAMRFMHLRSEEEIKNLPAGIRRSMLAICDNNRVARSAISNHFFVFEAKLF